MANSEEKIAEFVHDNLFGQPDPDAIPRMSRMLHLDRTITDINVKDRTFYDATVLHYQAWFGTTGSVAWLLRQDPPPEIDVRSSILWTPLMYAACSRNEPDIVRLLLDHGADRDLKESKDSKSILEMARRYNRPAEVIDMLENYRPDVSR